MFLFFHDVHVTNSCCCQLFFVGFASRIVEGIEMQGAPSDAIMGAPWEHHGLLGVTSPYFVGFKTFIFLRFFLGSLKVMLASEIRKKQTRFSHTEHPGFICCRETVGIPGFLPEKLVGMSWLYKFKILG